MFTHISVIMPTNILQLIEQLSFTWFKRQQQYTPTMHFKLLTTQTITNIIHSCDRLNRHSKRQRKFIFEGFTHVYNTFSLNKSLQINHHLNSLKDDSQPTKQAKKNTLKRNSCPKNSFYKTGNDYSTIQNHSSLKKVKTLTLYGENILVNNKSKQKFRQSLYRYKKNYFPINASKGQRCSTEFSYIKTPREVKQYLDDHICENIRKEMKNMSLINRILQQNNRKKSFLANKNKLTLKRA